MPCKAKKGGEEATRLPDCKSLFKSIYTCMQIGKEW